MKGTTMNTLMRWIEFWDRKVKHFTICDLKLAQLWTAAWILILLKLFPQILQLSIWWFVGLAVLCAPRLFYVLYFKPITRTPATS